MYANFQREIYKIYDKIQRKIDKIGLSALNLCKIYAKFNTKYVRSTPKFNAKLC